MKGEGRDVLGDKVEELGGNLVTQGLVGNGREFGFSTKCNGNHWRVFSGKMPCND